MNQSMPHDMEIEKHVLGSMLIDNMACEVAIDLLNEESFYPKKHKTIFRAIRTIYERDESIDIITARDELKGEMQNIGGENYLAEITNIPTSANIEEHCNLVKNYKLLRDMIIVSNEIQKRSYLAKDRASDIIQEAEKRFFELGHIGKNGKFINIEEGMHKTIEHIEKLYSLNGDLLGLPTGYERLDKMLGGLQTGLIILAARTSVGKTAFAMNIAKHIAFEDHPIGIFSLESSQISLVMRLLSTEAKIDLLRLRSGKLQEDEFKIISRIASRMAKTRIYFDTSFSLNTIELVSRIRRMKSLYDVELVIIDYLQLIYCGSKFETRNLALGDVTRRLKALTEELNIPVLLLSQLSRAPERRTNKEPVLSDLRESGNLEQDADVVIFIYRQKMYDESLDDIAKIIIAKQREGPTGYIELMFKPEYVSFEKIDKAHEEN